GGSSQRSERQLPFGSDIEQSRVKSYRDRDASEHQRRRVKHCHAQVIARSKGAAIQNGKDAQRILSGKPRDEQTGRQARDQRKERPRDLSHRASGAPALASIPAIRKPNWLSLTLPRKNSATIRPSSRTRIRSDSA